MTLPIAPPPPLPILRCTQDKKYNAQQVLAAFARTARDETEMEALLVEKARWPATFLNLMLPVRRAS